MPFLPPNQQRQSTEGTGYASQHYPVPVPSQDKLEGLWQKGHSVLKWGMM